MASFGLQVNDTMAALEKDLQYDSHAQLLNHGSNNQYFPSNHSVLNQADQEFLDHFWAHPNAASDNNSLFTGFPTDQKINSHATVTHSTDLKSPAPSAHNTSTLFAEDPAASFSTQSNNFFAPGPVNIPNDQILHPSTGDTDVTAAASSLFGMAEQGLNGNMHTWGHLSYAGAPGHMNEGHNQSTSTTPSASFSPAVNNNHAAHQLNHHRSNSMNLNPFQNVHHPHQHSAGLHAPQNPFSGFAHHQYFPPHIGQEHWPIPHISMSGGHPFKPPIQWGSDHSFSSQGFRGYVPQEIDKGKNLLGVPLANQAAGRRSFSQVPTTTSATDSQTSYFNHGRSNSDINHQHSFQPLSGHGGYHTPTLSAGLPHGHPHESKTVPDGPCDEMAGARPTKNPARKRRRTMVEHEDDADYQPPTPHMKSATASSSKNTPKTKRAKGSEGNTVNINEAANAVATPIKRRKSSIADNSAEISSPESEGSADSSGSHTHSGSKKSRQNLSDGQKRDNHIKSEQRRRNLIKDGYADIERMVPSLKSGKSGLSKSDALFEAVKFIQKLTAGNAAMEARLGVRFEKVFVSVADADTGDDE